MDTKVLDDSNHADLQALAHEIAATTGVSADVAMQHAIHQQRSLQRFARRWDARIRRTCGQDDQQSSLRKTRSVS